MTKKGAPYINGSIHPINSVAMFPPTPSYIKSPLAVASAMLTGTSTQGRQKISKIQTNKMDAPNLNGVECKRRVRLGEKMKNEGITVMIIK